MGIGMGVSTRGGRDAEGGGAKIRNKNPEMVRMLTQTQVQVIALAQLPNVRGHEWVARHCSGIFLTVTKGLGSEEQ